MLPFQALTYGQQSINSADGLGSSAAPAPSPTVNTGTQTTFRDIFTMPASVDQGANLLPYVKDPSAVDAQTVCPGYTASQADVSDNGLTAVLTLAGAPCNLYGTDVDVLDLKVEYQSAHRLSVSITPANIVSAFSPI